MVEEFKEWPHPSTEFLEKAIDRDRMLTNEKLYWLTEDESSAAQLYTESMQSGNCPGRTSVPTGVAVVAEDIPIRRFAEQGNNSVHWSEFDRGGHFAAMEAPELLVGDVRDFFRSLR